MELNTHIMNSITMVVTRFRLIGANSKVITITFEGNIENPFEFIKTTNWSDYKIVNYEVIDLGKVYLQV